MYYYAIAPKFVNAQFWACPEKNPFWTAFWLRAGKKQRREIAKPEQETGCKKKHPLHLKAIATFRSTSDLLWGEWKTTPPFPLSKRFA